MQQLTPKDKFIQKAQVKHGNKYDYSKVIYTGDKDKVEIVCPIHGSFWQRPSSHTSGVGCKHCGPLFVEAASQFVTKAREKHGNKYDYSKVVYVGSKKKVEIICPEHGSFWQTSGDHLAGCGCRTCSGQPRYTTESFIAKAEEVHGLKYEYCKVVYTDNKTKVEIICPEHGSFWQTPSNHINNKQGCPTCGVNGLTMSLSEFKNRAWEVHGFRYDYRKVVYVGSRDKVEIICREHGSFWQRPHDHLNNKQGCPVCAKSTKMTHVSFLEQAQDIWGNMYDYSRVVFDHPEIPILIKCKSHNLAFKQTPYNHLNGAYGCPKCRNDPDRTSTLYIIHCTGNGESFYKVGMTHRTVEYRMRGSRMPYDFTIIYEWKTTAHHGYFMEKGIKTIIASNDRYKYTPLIEFGGSPSECFQELDEVLSYAVPTLSKLGIKLNK